MLVADLMDAMESIAPLAAAETWDRVGLLVGDPERRIGGPVLLTIDLTERVLDEAVELGAGAIVAYHPPIWTPLDRLTASTPAERVIRRSVEAGIAIYSPHTALDAAAGGVTDWLCEGLSAPVGEAEVGRIQGDCRALSAYPHRDGSREVKLVTFVPEPALDSVRSALATAGAGGIGRYRVCSFASLGTGTFFPQEGADPAVGEVGRLERVEEYRLEMVCPRRALPLAIETLRQFHPYEEPAFDVFELEPEPDRRTGPGRRLVLDRPATVGELAERLKAHLGRARVRGSTLDDDRPVGVIGVVPGAGESMRALATAEGCELFVTGEMKHHEVLASLHAGTGVLLAGHTNTERGYLGRLAQQLRERLTGVEFRCSDRDEDMLRVY